MFGRRHTMASRKKMSETRKGSIPWNKGLKGYRAGIPKPWKRVSDEKNPSWKGDSVGYRGLHLWVTKHLGKPNKCSHCGILGEGHKMHWANKSGDYLRELSDWIRLCVKCHGKHDKMLRKIKLKIV